MDDDASIRRSLHRLLRGAGYRVAAFGSGEQCLRDRDINASVPACLILDVKLPGLSDFDVHELLAERGVAVPTIFITGDGDWL